MLLLNKRTTVRAYRISLAVSLVLGVGRNDRWQARVCSELALGARWRIGLMDHSQMT